MKVLFEQQLKSTLYKNVLLKKANKIGFLMELILPVGFMCLLILIKSTVDIVSSPNIAYYCGNTFPWFYSESLPEELTNFLTTPPITCTQKPTTCKTKDYYQFYIDLTSKIPENDELPDDIILPKIGIYEQLGNIQSAASMESSNNPFYAFTIADNSNIYERIESKNQDVIGISNPSLPLKYILKRMKNVGSLLALVTDIQDKLLQEQINNLQDYINIQTGTNWTNIIQFTSSKDFTKYITNVDYDKIGYKSGKIGLAIILNSVNITSMQWDYSIRTNYSSYGVSQTPTTTCLYGTIPGNNYTINIDDDYYINPDDASINYIDNKDMTHKVSQPNNQTEDIHSTNCAYTFSIPSTRKYTNDLSKPQSVTRQFGYSYSGFSTLQQFVDQYIFSVYGLDINIHASISFMPTEEYTTSNFQAIISSTLGLFYMLSFLYPVSRLIRALVLEKEGRIKEGMKMMGLSDTVYNLSWLITSLFQFTIVSILITLVTADNVFEYSNKFIVFLFFEVFSLAIINFCFLLATLFSKSKSASLLGPIIFFSSFFPYYAVRDASYSLESKTITCLFAPACFALGANVFATFEGGMVGVRDSNIDVFVDNFSYNTCVIMMFIDSIIYGLLAWYLDKVLPSEYGTRLPYYFPLMKNYWFPIENTTSNMNSLHLNNDNNNNNNNLKESLLDNASKIELGERDSLTVNNQNQSFLGNKFEQVNESLLQQQKDMKCIRIKALRKVYETTGEDRVAVDNLDMEMYEGQITVLLGHNGAGKSTTISMLTGLIQPTSGDVLIRNNLISTDLTKIRQNLGICPQHDILFPELTVMEHLQIFGSFKGISSENIDIAAEKMIIEVGLTEKKNSKTSTLSGGQKRKLSLAIALLGDSKIIILDEPTSGMDPYSRRSTWNIIQKNKKGRVILLTTHFMDEADCLADRIAIMADGKLQCMGSSLFLKGIFGIGYTLIITHNLLDSSNNNAEQNEINRKNIITSLVKKYINCAEILSSVGNEQSFRLPFSSSNMFPKMFNELDQRKMDLKITEYSISVTTLDEVFMLAGGSTTNHHAVPNSKRFRSSNILSNDSNNKKNSRKLTIGDEIDIEDKDDDDGIDKYMFYKHFKAQLYKRIIYGGRDKNLLICQLILPVLIVILGLSLLLLKPSLEEPNLLLDSSKYNTDLNKKYSNFVPFNIDYSMGNDDNISNSLLNDMMDRFNGDINDGIDGISVGIFNGNMDMFDNCAQGATPLYNMSNYLLQDQYNNEKGSSRYGAITLSSLTNLSNLVYNVMVNLSANHGVGIYVNELHNSYLQAATGFLTARIKINNHPLPPTYNEQHIDATISSFVVALFCMIAFCFIPSNFVTFIVKEREVKAKHQQLISGCNIYSYWLSTYIWDSLSYFPTGLCVILIMNIYNVSSFIEGEAATAMYLLFILFGPAIASFTYLISFLFQSHSTAQITVMFFNFISGLCLMITSFVLATIDSTMEINYYLRYLFKLFPSFCLGDGILQLAICSNGLCAPIKKTGFDLFNLQSPLSWDIVGSNLVFLAIELVVYFAFTIFIEYLLTFPNVSAWLYYIPDDDDIIIEDEDEDVKIERNRVENERNPIDIIRLSQIRRIYYKNGSNYLTLLLNKMRFGIKETKALRIKSNIKVAVNSLSFGIPLGECFGFLGINGAGKSTTLSILSGEIPQTSGEAFINNLNIQKHQITIRRKVGYCPQFDALIDLLTVKEHLELYGRIKGFTDKKLNKIVLDKINSFDLVDFKDKTAGSLSGGNKRKLSVAIATIGNPSIVFLDEPSTGMDPVARRFMWSVISDMSTGINNTTKTSVILTTHSMEEAEALCARIGVMVNGKLKCLGSSQHLKHKFGNGYEINIKIGQPTLKAMMSLYKILINNQKLCQISNFITDFNPLLKELDNIRSIYDSENLGDKKEFLNIIENIQIKYDDLPIYLNALGNLERINLIIEKGAGFIIYNILKINGFISLKLLLEWFISEDNSDILNNFMCSEFKSNQLNGSILLERGTNYNYKYRVLKNIENVINDDINSPLSVIFDKFENNKAYLNIIEYSCGQTTLEQIFNQLASTSENPEVGN